MGIFPSPSGCTFFSRFCNFGSTGTSTVVQLLLAYLTQHSKDLLKITLKSVHNHNQHASYIIKCTYFIPLKYVSSFQQNIRHNIIILKDYDDHDDRHWTEMMCRIRSADVHSQHAWAANVDAARTNQNIYRLQESTNRIAAIQHLACITAVPVLETCLKLALQDWSMVTSTRAC